MQPSPLIKEDFLFYHFFNFFFLKKTVLSQFTCQINFPLPPQSSFFLQRKAVITEMPNTVTGEQVTVDRTAPTDRSGTQTLTLRLRGNCRRRHGKLVGAGGPGRLLTERSLDTTGPVHPWALNHGRLKTRISMMTTPLATQTWTEQIPHGPIPICKAIGG